MTENAPTTLKPEPIVTHAFSVYCYWHGKSKGQRKTQKQQSKIGEITLASAENYDLNQVKLEALAKTKDHLDKFLRTIESNLVITFNYIKVVNDHSGFISKEMTIFDDRNFRIDLANLYALNKELEHLSSEAL